MNTSRKIFFLLFYFFFFTFSVLANTPSTIGVPLIRSFDFSGSGLRTNWSIVQDKRGVMFFGVQGGVLEFNGAEGSNLILMPNGSTVRSLCTDENGIVYVGARKEIGFLKPNANGELVYQSLVSKLDKKDQNFTEVSKVYTTAEGICFQSFEALYFYRNGKFKIINSSTSFHFSFYLNSILYVLERGVGLEKYENGILSVVPGGEVFSENRIYSILPFEKNKLIIATRESGLFTYDLTKVRTENIQAIAPKASNYLIENQVYSGVKLKNGNFIYGTLQGGLILLDDQGDILTILNKVNLLNEEKVNDLYLDSFDDLWIAQENSVSIIELNSPFSLLRQNNGLNGNILSFIEFQNSLFVATTIGVFYIPISHEKEQISNPRFKQLDFKSECFNLLKWKCEGKEKLFVASAAGFFEIVNNQLVSILSDYCFYAYQSPSNPNIIYVGLKNGFAVLTNTNGKWKIGYPDTNIKDEIKSIAEDHLGNLWLGSSKEGIYRIKKKYLNNLNAVGSKEFPYEKYDTLKGLPDVILNKVFPLGKDVIYGTKNGFYDFDTIQNKFVPDFKLNSVLNNTVTQIADFNTLDSNEYIVLAAQENDGPLLSILKRENNHQISNYSKPFRRLSEFLINSFNLGSKNEVWIGATGYGMFLADIKTIQSNKKNYERKYNLLIRRVSIGNDSLLFSGTYFENKTVNNQTLSVPVLIQPLDFIPEIEYKFNTISFNFSYSFNEPSSYNYFSYYLEGFESEWKPWTLETKLSFNNLSEGTYILHLKAKNIYESESDETQYKFVILPPWYRSIWAYLIYILLFVGFVYAVVQLSVRRLKRAKTHLEKTVKERTSEILKQSKEIQLQKDIVEIKNKDITDSINYAKRIQDAILPPDNEIKQLLPDSFILFLPKDILSGDFYWMDEIDNKVLVAVVDCTGHGVPGALMSIVGNNILSQSINEHRISKPAAILDELNKGVTNTLRQKNEESKVKDGMDIVLISIDKRTSKIEFAGANNPIYHIRNGELMEIKGNKFPIGIFIGEELRHFTNHEIEVQKGDTLYLFTDGYADQFGGPAGKKFKYNQFKANLLEIQKLPMKAQRETLLSSIRNWQGENEQVDDILVIGIKI